MNNHNPDCLCPTCFDPYEQFALWAEANGFADISIGKPEDVDLARLEQAVNAYAEAK